MATQTNIHIRPLRETDWQLIWPMLKAVFRAGETYAFDPAIRENDARHAWIELPLATYVAAENGGKLLGTYFIKPNQPGLGSHVCNCGYIVAEHARGNGVAALLCDHSQQTARTMGFRAMQYNLVVSTNAAAIRLWTKKGFAIVGTLPKAFKSLSAGYIDAFVMYKELDS